MEKSTKIMLGIGVAAAALAGFLFWKNKQDSAAIDEAALDVPPATIPESSATSTVPSGGGFVPDENIKKFQDWMDLKHPKWVKATNATLSNGTSLNKGGGYGNNGVSTQKAMAKYGSEYKTSTGAPAPTTAVTVAPVKSTGFKAYAMGKMVRAVPKIYGTVKVYKNPSDWSSLKEYKDGQLMGTGTGANKREGGKLFYELSNPIDGRFYALGSELNWSAPKKR